MQTHEALPLGQAGHADCGVTAITAALLQAGCGGAGLGTSDEVREAVIQHCPGYAQGAWSLELALAAQLACPELEVALWSQHPGANEEHASVPGELYGALDLAAENERLKHVARQYLAAHGQVHVGTVDLDVLAEHCARKGCTAVVLVDARRLPWSCPSVQEDSDFRGHYLTCWGYSFSADELQVMDSADGGSMQVLTPAQLDWARAAAGTDYDAVLLRMPSVSS